MILNLLVKLKKYFNGIGMIKRTLIMTVIALFVSINFNAVLTHAQVLSFSKGDTSVKTKSITKDIEGGKVIFSGDDNLIYTSNGLCAPVQLGKPAVKLTISEANGCIFDINSFKSMADYEKVKIDLTYADDRTTTLEPDGISSTELSTLSPTIKNVKKVVLSSEISATFQDFDIVNVRQIPAKPGGASLMPATNITAKTATLNAEVTAGGEDTTVYFNYGTKDNSLGTKSSERTVALGSKVIVAIDISGLSPGIRYYYEVVARNAGGIVTHNYNSFDTLPEPPTAPVASNVSISGTANVGETLTGNYTYSDANGDVEGTSTFKWYRSDDALGKNKTEIEGATGKTYALKDADAGKYISFEVTPVDSSTVAMKGTAVESSKTSFIKTVYTITTVVDGTTSTTKVPGDGQTTYSPTDPVKAGYIFDSWYTDPDFNNEWTGKGQIVTSALTLYARFQPEWCATYRGAQMRTNADKTYDIRFIATIDTLDPDVVGFVLSKSETNPTKETANTKILCTTKVYNSITAMGSTVTAESLGGTYIIACTIKNIPEADINKPLYIRAFATKGTETTYTKVHTVTVSGLK